MVKSTMENLSRREFLAYGFSSAVLLKDGLNNPPEAAIKTNDKLEQRSLLLIYLNGGNDGFNTLVPYGDKRYYDCRPNLALRGDEIEKIDDRFAFNFALKELAQLYREGVVAVFPKVGCQENLTRSHLRASRIWETASPDEKWKTSWHDRMRPAVSSVSKVVIEGFDTHVNQRQPHFNALRKLSVSLDLLRPRLENTLVLVYSEFGRTLAENSMGGTDHGSTGLCLILGRTIRGGIYPIDGESLIEHSAEFDDGAIDFRSLYASIATDWFKCSWNGAPETNSQVMNRPRSVDSVSSTPWLIS